MTGQVTAGRGTRALAGASAVTTAGAGIFVAGAPGDIAQDTLVVLVAGLVILLSLPSAILATTGELGRVGRGTLFVTGLAWVFVTVLFTLAHNGGWESWGLTVILAGCTMGAFALWRAVRR